MGGCDTCHGDSCRFGHTGGGPPLTPAETAGFRATVARANLASFGFINQVRETRGHPAIGHLDIHSGILPRTTTVG